MHRSRTDLRTPPEAIQVGSIPDRSQKSANVHIDNSKMTNEKNKTIISTQRENGKVKIEKLKTKLEKLKIKTK